MTRREAQLTSSTVVTCNLCDSDDLKISRVLVGTPHSSKSDKGPYVFTEDGTPGYLASNAAQSFQAMSDTVVSLYVVCKKCKAGALITMREEFGKVSMDTESTGKHGE